VQVKVSELQHSAAAAAKEAASSAALSLQKLQAAATSSMAGLRRQMAQLQGEVKGQLAQLAQQEEAALQQAAARWVTWVCRTFSSCAFHACVVDFVGLGALGGMKCTGYHNAPAQKLVQLQGEVDTHG
jgi:hypothetical protein